MECERAEDAVPCAASPDPDVSLMKTNFRKVAASCHRNGKGCRIEIHGIYLYGESPLPAPCHDFTGKISLACGKIEDSEWFESGESLAQPAF